MKLAKKWAWPLKLVALIFSVSFTSHLAAQDLTVFDSRRPISLTAVNKTYRDFYINGGVEHGVKKGMILTVTRRLTLYDSYRANSPKELMVEVGRVKIIYAQKGLSVARYYGEFSRSSKAVLENDFIMVGDKIDMSSALMESQLKKKSAQKSGHDRKKTKKKMVSSSVDFASSAAKQQVKASNQPVPMKSLQ